MTDLLPDLVRASAALRPDAAALIYRAQTLTYRELADTMTSVAAGLLAHGLQRGERVAVYLEKRPETVTALLAASAAGGAFVPINPVLRAGQVRYILTDCNVRVLVTSADRLRTLAGDLAHCPDLRLVVLVDGEPDAIVQAGVPVISWPGLGLTEPSRPAHRVLDCDMTAILYTSGSTGSPKGVVLSHRNIVSGAASVCAYLQLTANDRILSVLPLSFDYGLNQFVSAFQAGACVVIMNYLLPADVIRTVAQERITGLGCVPPLWIQLAALDWPEAAAGCLRYITNSGGTMPKQTLDRLRKALPHTDVFLMYGLTEAFRSTFLPPSEVARRPHSIGKAIPNVEIMVVREDGRLCGPDEEGELVHRGPLVSLGYWNDPERTAERFRPSPVQPPGISIPEIAVWSGDTVKMDTDGFLYFVGRRDDMIKTSGYRVSPSEIEEVVYASGSVGEAAAVGVPHAALGQGILVIATPGPSGTLDATAVIAACRQHLPGFMVPHAVIERPALPRNPNGKIDRRALADGLEDYFAVTAS